MPLRFKAKCHNFEVFLIPDFVSVYYNWGLKIYYQLFLSSWLGKNQQGKMPITKVSPKNNTSWK